MPKALAREQQYMFGTPAKKRATYKRKLVTWCLVNQRLDWFRQYFYDGQEGLHWYDETPLRILSLFGGDIDRTMLYLKLLASTSPLENIESNVRLALKALKLFDRYGADEKKIGRVFRFDAHYCNIMRSLTGLPLSGPKVSAFYKNLVGPYPTWKYGETEIKLPEFYPEAADAVTVDRWMMRVAKGICTDLDDPRDDAPSGPEYECVTRAVRKLATEAAVQPRQYQAAVWVGVKKRCGSPADRADPFEVAVERTLSSGQNEFDFDAPEPALAQLEVDPLGGLVPDDTDIYGVAEEERMASGNPPHEILRPLTEEEKSEITARAFGEA